MNNEDELAEIKRGIGELTYDVDSAVESGDDARQLAVGAEVAALVARYRAWLDKQSPADRSKIEMSPVARSITDLRRSSSRLTQRSSGGAEINRATDAAPFVESRNAARWIVPERGVPGKGPSVGQEIDSWCGKCKEMRTHNVVAMVGSEPKQVVCMICQSRHAYRSEQPTRGGKSDAAAAETNTTNKPASKAEKEQKDAQYKLQNELAAATDVRQIEPKQKYKIGEIVSHPEYGRGKVEHVFKASLLVRFVVGLRPVNL